MTHSSSSHVSSGNFQPSLTGLFALRQTTQDWRPGLHSTVPAGLVYKPVLMQGLNALRFFYAGECGRG